MRHLNLPMTMICIAISLTAQAAEPPFTGRFLGSGRACYGTLVVSATTISWLTSFSQCQAVPVELVERDDSGRTVRATYRFKTRSSSCRFTALSLSHDGTKNPDIGWQAVGYASEARFNEDKASGYTINTPDMMSCALIRDPGRHGKSSRGSSQSTKPNR